MGTLRLRRLLSSRSMEQEESALPPSPSQSKPKTKGDNQIKMSNRMAGSSTRDDNCIGAIDGTHIRVKVSKEDVSRYRGRKNYPTMNVLVACTFDLKFTYVLPGWEGSASDSRILDNALSKEDNLNVPQGKFYLVDAGYMLRSTFLTPYRSTRYHLKEYSQHPPENPKELFNLRHFSLHNAIERAFGVLKNRFPILAEMSRYDVETVSEIVLACYILHNFLVDFDPDEEIIAQVDRDLMNNESDHGLANGAIARGEDGRRGEILRDSIAAQMWSGDMDAEKVFEVEGGNDCNAYFKWTTKMDGVMLEVLREQKSKGQKEDRAFSTETYRKVVEEINDIFSLNINKTKMMNRLKTLKEQMVLAKEIEFKSGIGWNDSSKTFEAPLEVWKSLIKYKNIKGKSLHHLEILREIYEKDVATGAQAESAKEKVQKWEREEAHISIDEIDEMQANNQVYLDNFSTFDFESMPSIPGSQFGTSNPFVPNASVAKGKKGKAPMTNEYSSQLNEVSSAMKDIAQAILNTNTQVWKPAEIYEAVAKLGLEVDKLFKAVELLNKLPNLIGVFFGFP
ncbi:hypothetical protein ZIOFF_004635 [Zingiber officinale]|uniref:DDE Tnp4 domain-containing protein n=1 Tax=Zingiber officinale TaxID=94328 RepID=A0A8J5HUF4_ZINOF|nr:hypothetical protein ZIOFF_004635 [Zingiber officinale]